MNAPIALDVPQLAKLTVDDFVTLDRAGAFEQYGKTELLDGVVVYVNAQYASHYTLKSRLYRRIADACDGLDPALFAWTEGAIQIRPHAVPEPDIFITTREPDEPLIGADMVRLVVEIASTTLSTDLGYKARLYARAGIAEYWEADTARRVIHQLWSPAIETYEQRREIALGSPLVAATIDGLAIDTGGL
jgi:Uma2 family endonuclease